MRDELIVAPRASRRSGAADEGRRETKRTRSVPAVFAGLYLGSGAAIGLVQADVWRPHDLEVTVAAVLFPAAYLGLFLSLHRYWPVRWLPRASVIVAHLTTLGATPFALLYILVAEWMLPVQVFILPAAFVALGWMAVLPLTIFAFARSRAWSDLVPLLGNIFAVGVSFPVMLNVT